MIYTNSKYPTAEDVREEAFEECKIGGNPAKGLVLALVYLGDRAQEIGHHDLENSLRELGTSIENAGVR